jgi:hypothetical protein
LAWAGTRFPPAAACPAHRKKSQLSSAESYYSEIPVRARKGNKERTVFNETTKKQSNQEAFICVPLSFLVYTAPERRLSLIRVKQ